VVEGTRYILAGFVRVRPLAEAWPRIFSPVAPRRVEEEVEDDVDEEDVEEGAL
jgi:hypothetical protein